MIIYLHTEREGEIVNTYYMPDLCVNIKQMTNGSCDCQSNSIAYPTGYGSGFNYVRYVPNANLLTSFLLQSITWWSGGRLCGRERLAITMPVAMAMAAVDDAQLDKRNQQFTDVVCVYPNAAQCCSIGPAKMTVIRMLISMSLLVSSHQLN